MIDSVLWFLLILNQPICVDKAFIGITLLILFERKQHYVNSFTYCQIVRYRLSDSFSSAQGVQPLLDGVLSYLPCPVEVSNYALDQTKNEEKV